MHGIKLKNTITDNFMTPVITKEASTFYSLMAMLKISGNFIDFLVSSKSVARSLKFDLNQLRNNINRIDRICNQSLEGSEAQQWRREWSDRDYEVYSSILFSLNDMSEEQRSIMEQFAIELQRGNVEMSLKQSA